MPYASNKFSTSGITTHWLPYVRCVRVCTRMCMVWSVCVSNAWKIISSKACHRCDDVDITNKCIERDWNANGTMCIISVGSYHLDLFNWIFQTLPALQYHIWFTNNQTLPFPFCRRCECMCVRERVHSVRIISDISFISSFLFTVWNYVACRPAKLIIFAHANRAK